MAHNRLLNFHVVRATRPVIFTPAAFIPDKDCRTPRDPSHVEKFPNYPDPHYYLSLAGKYFFRHESLWHLRLEQFNRYFSLAGEGAVVKEATLEDTCEDDSDPVDAETHHRHYDATAEALPAGTLLAASVSNVEGARRRKQARLAVSRVPFIEPLGVKREAFYEQRLLLALPWHCEQKPVAVGEGAPRTEWRFVFTPPSPEKLGGVELPEQELCLLSDQVVSFEKFCADAEKEICKTDHNLVCACCAGDRAESVCKSCEHAVGFHWCRHASHMRWRKGTLHGGDLDIERVMFHLHCKGLPKEIWQREK